jgi:hypothetical protein
MKSIGTFVSRKIQENKDITIEAEKRVQQTMDNFQTMFNNEIKNLEDRIRADMQQEMDYARAEIKYAQDTMYTQ